MSTLVFDAARSLPRAIAQPLPSEAARAKAAVKRIVAIAAISLVLCSVPSDGGPARIACAAVTPQSSTVLDLLRNADR